MKKNKKVSIIKIIFKMILFIGFVLVVLDKILSKRTKRDEIDGEENNSNLFYNSSLGKIFYKVSGEGEPLLLIHRIGVGESSFEYSSSIDELSKKYKVYTIDLLGFGCSDKPNITYTAFIYVKLITEFIKNVIGEPAYVVASGISTSFTMMAAYKESYLFKKILLICPTGIQNLISFPTKKSSLIKKVLEIPIVGDLIYKMLSSKRIIENILKKELYADEKYVNDEIIEYYYMSAHIEEKGAKHAIASFLGGYMNLDIKDIYKEIMIPIYVIDSKKTILEANSQYTVVEDTKCFPHIESKEVFEQVCLEMKY